MQEDEEQAMEEDKKWTRREKKEKVFSSIAEMQAEIRILKGRVRGSVEASKKSPILLRRSVKSASSVQVVEQSSSEEDAEDNKAARMTESCSSWRSWRE
jgi:F0F1-type ATP synthase membrane subunit b/b'